jgi:glycosyltransferase involved in cell wall biosynthesis
MSKKLLVILYTFPPFPGVGGRRWAKFSKYLAQRDYNIHVLCSENPYKEQSLWVNDVKHSQIKTHILPVNYPGVMLHGAKSMFDKISYRLWKIYFSMYSKGVVFERTMFWEKQLLQKASSLIEQEGITNLIVSIPPYRLGSYSIKLKQKYPHINFIVDYRDPWTDNKSFHGFKDISTSRLTYEKEIENNLIASADSIVSVSNDMTKDLKTRSIKPEKVITIPNGYDPDDIMPDKKVTKTDVIKFVYAGTLYNDLEYIITPLINYLKKLKAEGNEIFTRLQFEFYGSINAELKEKLITANLGCVLINAAVPLNEMQKILNDSSFCILITPPDYSVVFNTKFCEYLANRKPIILFTYPCESSDFLVANKLGFHINPANIESDLNKFFSEMDNVIANFNYAFDLTPFSVPYLTSQIEKLLK